jgi:hypothetical protein
MKTTKTSINNEMIALITVLLHLPGGRLYDEGKTTLSNIPVSDILDKILSENIKLNRKQ